MFDHPEISYRIIRDRQSEYLREASQGTSAQSATEGQAVSLGSLVSVAVMAFTAIFRG